MREIKSRADRIGVSLKVLAHDVGIDASTAYRGAGGSDVRLSTARRLSEALISRERTLLAYLVGLHGAESIEEAAE